MSGAFPFLRLPLELREQIYSLYFNPASRLHLDEHGPGHYLLEFALYRVNKQVYSEASTVFRRENVFVRIETPWSQAVNHISQEGLVPIVATGGAHFKFNRHTALVQICAPSFGSVPSHTIILLLDDLHLFTQVWFYSALNFTELNSHLRVVFELRDPYYPADPKPVPIHLQRRLLLPFSDVKGLYEYEVLGYEESVKRELDERMETPYPTVQECCEGCLELANQGDLALSSKKPEEALQLYVKAFHSIHILISGRLRRVLADSWFHQAIESGRFSGQSGATVRIILRIQLVSRTIKAYLMMGKWEEAAFWGIRSIKLMQEAIGTEFEDFMTEFVGALDVGLMHLRTAIAFSHMESSQSKELEEYYDEEMASSRVLFESASRFLKGKNRGLVQGELEETATKAPQGIFEFGSARSPSVVDSMEPMHVDEAETRAADK